MSRSVWAAETYMRPSGTMCRPCSSARYRNRFSRPAVVGEGVAIVTQLRPVGEVDGERRAESRDDDGHASHSGDAVDKALPHPVRVNEGGAMVARQFGQCRIGRSQGNRVAIEATAERHAVVHLHQDVGAPRDAAERRAAADRLPEGRQIRNNLVITLRAAEREAETRDHLVEDKKDAALHTEPAGLLEIARARENAAAVAQHRLHNDGSDVAGRRCAVQHVDVIPLSDGEVLGGVGDLPPRTEGGSTELISRRFIADERAVHPAVIVTFELEDAVAAGERAGEAEGDLAGLAAAGSELHQLGAGHEALDLFGDLELQFVLGAVVGGKLRLPAHRLHDGGMAVAEDHRTPGEAVVDILIAVDILQACTEAVAEVERHGRLDAEGAAHASCQRSLRPFQILTRSAPVHRISINSLRSRPLTVYLDVTRQAEFCGAL